MPEVPFIVEQKSLSDYEILKESPAEVKLLVEIYERRIAELNAVIEKLLEQRRPMEAHMTPSLNSVPMPTKNKIATTSQLVAEMERRVRIEAKK